MPRIFIQLLFVIAALPTTMVGAASAAELVKVTPLGGQEGEFCRQDRALIFEDPNGARLYMMPGAPWPAPRTRVWVRSMLCS
jgi:hypothetical protein